MPRTTPFIAATFLIGSGGCIASSLPKTPWAGGPAWNEVTTEHFVVDTDLDPQQSDIAIRQLENLRRVMAEVVFGGEPPRGARTRVLALRRDEYAYFDRKNTGLFINNALFQPILVTSPGGGWDTYDSDVRKHELAHYVSSLYVDTRLQPRWLCEGLAVWLETARYDESTGAVEIGHRPTDYEYLSEMRLATPEDLWAWNDEVPYDALRARLYQTSWAAVHYLADQRGDELRAYERALAHGEDARTAWNQIFPDLDNTGLGEAIKKYLHKKDFKIAKAKVLPQQVAMQSRPLNDDDVLGFRALLHMAMQFHSKRTPEESKKLATSAVEASLAIDPASFWAHQVNFFYFDKVPDSVELAKKSIASQKDNWLAWTYYAEALRRSKGPLDEQRTAIGKALDLAPGNRIALTQLAWIEAREGRWSGSLDASQKALRTPPVSTDSLVVFAVGLSHTNRCDEARPIEEKIVKDYKNKLPSDVSEILDENRRACRSAADSR